MFDIEAWSAKVIELCRALKAAGEPENGGPVNTVWVRTPALGSEQGWVAACAYFQTPPHSTLANAADHVLANLKQKLLDRRRELRVLVDALEEVIEPPEPLNAETRRLLDETQAELDKVEDPPVGEWPEDARDSKDIPF